MEFLIDAARSYLSIVCQSPVKFFHFMWKRNTYIPWTLSKVMLSVSIPHLRNLFQKFLCELGMSRKFRTGQKDQFLHCYWLWEKLNISDVGIHQTNNNRETFERGCRLNLPGNYYVLILISSMADWPSPECLEFFCFNRVDIVAHATFSTTWYIWPKFRILRPHGLQTQTVVAIVAVDTESCVNGNPTWQQISLKTTKLSFRYEGLKRLSDEE